MSQPPLSDRLSATIAPFLSNDTNTALAQVPEPLASLLTRFKVPHQKVKDLAKMVVARSPEIDALDQALDDELSRTRIFEFFAVKILGPTRFATAAQARWIGHIDGHSAITVTSGEDGIDNHAQSFEGCELRYLAPFGNAISPFLERQYFLERPGLRIRPEPGETALDFGAGAGDTSLAFAAAVGAEGRVLACEPTPSELVLQARNVAANPDLAPRITPVAAAVSDRAGQEIFLAGETTHAHIAPDGTSEGERAITTTIDAMVTDHGLTRLDFIKLDIEGMELPALQGAAQSLPRFHPKLAICIYHGWQIFDVLPWVRDTLRDYSLHLETHSPIGAETVLYAQPKPR